MKKIKPKELPVVKHELLLLSLLILLFGQLFIPPAYHELTRPLLFIQTIFAGVILFYEKKRWRNVFIALLITTIIMELVTYFNNDIEINSATGVIYMFFFLSVSVETYRQMYNTKEVGVAMIAAVFSGFILLCMIASLFFMIIEIFHPESFSNLGSGDDKFQNLTYFSFITTLTIGYGDIAPLTMHAKKATMLIALLGNFYTVFVTGIVIGKYLNQKSSAKE